MNVEERKKFIERGDAGDPSKQLRRKAAVAIMGTEGDPEKKSASAMAVQGITKPERMFVNTETRELTPEGKDYEQKLEAFVKSLSNAELGQTKAETIDSDKDFQRALEVSGRDVKALSELRTASSDVREAFTNLERELNSVTGRAVIHNNGMTINNQDLTRASFDNYDAAPAEVRKKLQAIMDNIVADLDEKALPKINPDTIARNEYFQKSMIKSFTPEDIRRVARTQEGAQAVKIAFETQAGILNVTNNTERYQKGEQFARNLEQANKRLAAWLESTPGEMIVGQGRRSTRRDLPMGEATTQQTTQDQTQPQQQPQQPQPPPPNNPPPTP